MGKYLLISVLFDKCPLSFIQSNVAIFYTQSVDKISALGLLKKKGKAL